MKYHKDALFPHKATLMSAAANLLKEEVCLPAAVIKKSALENNILWMQRYADKRGVSLAPHGKTTMAPWIFQQQQQAGAWAICVANAWQASIAMSKGIQRVLMANQLVGKANMQLIAQLKHRHPQTDYLCCVDSLENAQILSDFFSTQNQRLDVLIELGVPGGRCGCRSTQQALALAQQLSNLPGVKLRGLELYEGVIHTDNPQPQVEALLQDAAILACQLERYVDGEFILTGAGSVWYDVVCNIWLAATKPANCRVVIRPGCYITHDQGIYQHAQNLILARDTTACSLGGELTSALELVAMVQSVPEPGRVIANFGKRDSAFDAGLPQPIGSYRQGEAQPFTPARLKTVDIMDQHAMLQCEPECDIRVGDILIFSTSHPCLTFDKWKALMLVDEKYNVLETLETCF